MKTVAKKMMAMVVFLSCAAFLVGCAGSFGTWDEQWYSAHPTTQQEVIAHWGAPNKVIAHDDGTREMVYERKIPPSDAKSFFVYQVKDGQVIKQYWKEF